MADGRRNIKVDDETFEELRDAKPGGMTWDAHLLDLKERAVTTSQAARLDPAAERSLAKRVADEIEERFR